MALRQQVERLQKERKSRESLDMEGDLHMVDAPAEIKAKKIRELTKLNQKLLAQIEGEWAAITDHVVSYPLTLPHRGAPPLAGLHDQIAERDDQVLSLQEFQEEWTNKLHDVQAENVVLSEQTIRNLATIEDLRHKLQRRTEGYESLR